MSTLLLKKSFHTDLCQKVVDDIQMNRDAYYYFLGRIAESNKEVPVWFIGTVYEAGDIVKTVLEHTYTCISNNGDTPSMVQPDGFSYNNIQVADGYVWKYNHTLFDTPFSESTIRSEMITYQRIKPEDVSFVVPRYTWDFQNPIVYDQYDSTIDMTGKKFYCLTDDFKVYKCLFNNFGIPSTSKPTGTSYDVITTSDGYKWKYMYSIPGVKRNKFLTSTLMPVQRALSDRFYSNGDLSKPIILNPGSGYPDVAEISITGDGTGALLVPVIENGQVVDVQVISPGSGYTYATLSVVAPTGTGADLVVILADSEYNSDQINVEQTTNPGGIYAINVTTTGSGYTGTTTLSVVGDGTGCVAVPTIVSGAITKITVTSPGTNYTYCNIILDDDNKVDETPDCIAYGVISPQNGHGFDAVKEFGANTICIYTNIRHDNQLSTLYQDFREYGILKAPREYGSNNLLQGDYGRFTYDVTITTDSGTINDDTLKDVVLTVSSGSTANIAKYRVVEVYPDTNPPTAIVAAITDHVLVSGTVLKINPTDSYSYTLNIINEPTGNKYSGDMLLVSDSDAFTFTDEQEVSIKTYITL
jgi:hypothetical protein